MTEQDNIPEQTDITDDYDDDIYGEEQVAYRGMGNDPLLGLLISGAVSIGLAPIIGEGGFDLRYTLVWGMIAFFGVLSWLLGNAERVEQEPPEDLAWGIGFGLLLALPILAFTSTTLTEASQLLFRDLRVGTVLAYLVFVMPLAETLFFRNVLQSNQRFWETALYCTLWQLILFFPLVNREFFPIFVGIILLMANLMYGYVHERNGLAAAWLCQITINLTLIFLPFAIL